MTTLANGTYFITSSGSGGDRFYLGFSSGATGEALVLNTFTGSESHQWEVGSSNIPNVYTLRNRRYLSYATVDGSPEDRSPVVAATDPRNWYITGADPGYVIGIDQSATLIWTTYNWAQQENTAIVLWAPTKVPSDFWRFKPVNTSSSLPSPTSTSTAACPTCSCPAKEGMDLGDKIGLGVGLGVGIPTLLVAIVALFKDSPLANLIKGYMRPGHQHDSEGFNLIRR